MKQQRRLRIGVQLVALAALVVGEEDEPALVELLDEHHPNRRRAASRCGRDGSRLRLRHSGCAGPVEPGGELPQGIGIDVSFSERLRGVGHRSIMRGERSTAGVRSDFRRLPSTADAATLGSAAGFVGWRGESA